MADPISLLSDNKPSGSLLAPIPFNKPYLTGQETNYIINAVQRGQISGNGSYTKSCQSYLENLFGFNKCLLTTSCTDALEMSAILVDIKPGDEVIMPAYTFVSTANAFILRGAKIRFCDSGKDQPNMDAELISHLVNERTKAIVVVHYAGVACDMDPILSIAKKHGLYVIEDAAQAIDSTYKGAYLGTIGDLGTFSFHETKNIQCGEGGALIINLPEFRDRAEIIWEKGTNRSAFFRGEVDKYGWVDLGSSFLPSELNAAFLYAQLENLADIQDKRKHIWNSYHNGLTPLAESGLLKLPLIPDYASNNAHMFYAVCRSLEERTALLAHYRSAGVHSVFHYQSLHRSEFFKDRHDGRNLPNCDRYSDCLFRFPMYYELTDEQIAYVIKSTLNFFGKSA